MLRKMMIVLAVALAFSGTMPATGAFARGGGGGGVHIGGGGGHVGSHAGAHFGPRFPQSPATPSQVPAPLPSPPQAPVINGPLSPSGLPAMGGGS